MGVERYAYGYNNPSRFTDPTGHSPCDHVPPNVKAQCEQSYADEDDPDVPDPKVDEIFDDMSDEDDIAFNYPKDGCYARAHLMCQRVDNEYPDVAIGKIWAMITLDPLAVQSDVYGEVTWGWHVAPIISLDKTTGSSDIYVIDPSISTEPLTPEEWMEAMGDPKGATVQITAIGSDPVYPNGQPAGGDGYWATTWPFPESYDSYSERLMEYYGACGDAGISCPRLKVIGQ